MQNNQPKLTIFLGDTDESVAAAATAFDKSALLLNHNNYQQFLTIGRSQPTVVYTSLGDLPKNLKIVYEILSQADQIFYCPPEQWSDGKKLDIVDPGSSMQGLTEIILSILSDRIQINNYTPSVPEAIILSDQRKSTGPQLWSVGCSITHGIGVELQQRYGQLLANELGMQCSFLTRPGSAIDWSADQILRSDIREQDIVVWGLTNPERLTYVHDHQLLNGITVRSYDQYPEYKKIIDPSNLYSQNTFYRHFYSIQQVINFCKKTHAHLILVEILLGNHSMQRIFQSYKNYVTVDYSYTFEDSHIHPNFIDLGTDKLHPGPRQHQKYKEIILEKLKQLKIV